MTKSRLQSTVALLVAVALALAVASSMGSPERKPIEISFTSPSPPKVISQAEVYRLEVSWFNRDTEYSCQGHFVFIVKSEDFAINSADIMFTFEGSPISPQEYHDSLSYHLPEQTLSANEHGIVSVEVIYNKPGEYHWKIGIT